MLGAPPAPDLPPGRAPVRRLHTRDARAVCVQRERLQASEASLQLEHEAQSQALATARLQLATATQAVLKNGLTILGIDAPESM